MSSTHYPKADTKTQNFSGRYPGSVMAPNCLILHSTEGTGWPGYNNGASAPHFTARADFAAKRLVWRQHFPINRSARALVNKAGGVETNTANVIQVEIVGTCDPRASKSWGGQHLYMPDLPEWALRDLADFVKWVDSVCPKFEIRDGAPRGWLAYGVDSRRPGVTPASYGASPARMTNAEWRNFYGIAGHQHVPENSHGDPGDFPIERLIELAKGGATPAPTPDPAPSTTVYTVQPGDTMTEIARKHGLSLGQLLDLNNLSKIAVGDKISVGSTTAPAPDPTPDPEPSYDRWLKVTPYNHAAAAGNDYGVESLPKRIPLMEAIIESIKPDFVFGQECGGGDRLDSITAMYERQGLGRLPGGKTGRWNFANPDVVTVHATGTIEPPRDKTNDDKPSPWAVVEARGHRGLLINVHFNPQKGAYYDDLRVRQGQHVAAEAAKIAAAHDVDPDYIVIAGDTNSEGWVAEKAMKPAGLVDSFTTAEESKDGDMRSNNGWKPAKKGNRIDYVFVSKNMRVQNANQRLDHEASDHNAQPVILG